jgi:hypothetical protein
VIWEDRETRMNGLEMKKMMSKNLLNLRLTATTIDSKMSMSFIEINIYLGRKQIIS